jgi:hypothetical protein
MFRTSVAILFLVLQVGSIVYARFTPRRYFCWAPNDYVVEYQLDVDVAGHALPPEQVIARYHLSPSHKGLVEHPVEHLIDNIEQYETTYGKNDKATVRLRWRHNGHSQLREWRWPR